MRIFLRTGLALPNCKSSLMSTITACRRLALGAYGKHLIYVFCFIMFSYAHAQSPNSGAAKGLTEIKPLQIGVAIPDELWNTPLQVVNHPHGKKTTTLADYKGKLIILDFWATWCSNCIGNFPKLNKFQNDNSELVQVLLVNTKSTKDTHEKAEQFLSRRNEMCHFTSIVEDTVLTKLFPHRSIPHYVWVKEGKLLAVTNAEDLTAENVQNAFSGEAIETSFVPHIEYNMRKPLFENGNGGEPPKYIFKSVLAPFVNGLKSTMSRDRDSSRLISRITFTNIPLLTLYSYAYPELQKLSRARLILDVKDTKPFEIENTTNAWKTHNLYNYEVQLPPSPKEKVQLIVQQDLQRFFGYQIRSEVRLVDCWVVKAVDNPLATNFPNNIIETNLYDNDGSEIYFNNHPLSDLISELERLYEEPFLNETGIKVPVTLNLPANLYQKSALQSALASQGILLSKETREIPVIILSDH